jgi:NTP pyrophosphatase (non-canonical NTP hydrolase)
MDIGKLQAALREFASERDWHRFHTPKNLSTALMVEAAELAEIFQWMTADESVQSHADPATKRHIGEELADVLLYLLQIADKTGTDLETAVRDKLVLNARKHPPPWRAELDQSAPSSGPVTHVLLDYENVQPSEEEIRTLVPDATDVWIFHGKHQKQVGERFTSFGPAATAVPISKTGKNALDFHLSFYMGYITSRNQDASIVVISNDTGYEPVLAHAKSLGFSVRQEIQRREAPRPSAKAPAKKLPAKKAIAKKAIPAKATSVKKAPATKAAAKNAKAPVARKAAKATRAASATDSQSSAPSKQVVSGAATLQKILDGLRKMGDKRPVKVASLKRALKPFLGGTATEDDIESTFNNLIASGSVSISPSGDATYPRFK